MHAPNRLIHESSPYLRQHAHNPVDWYPWSEEALARARDLDRPIFLSIGYAACHWCHVMEHESFAETNVAAVLNGHFVPIKVDREERPDLDAVYMSAVQAMTGGGGWPLSVFLTPAGEPFFGGTYFPPDRRWGRASFLEVLEGVAGAWRERRDEVTASAATLLGHLREREAPPAPATLDLAAARHTVVSRLESQLDARFGGFGAAPKFPTPSRLSILLELATRDTNCRAMLASTLDGMAAGGMYDWLGSGFHRYSVDAQWLVPHFEKMLYDNALLLRVYGHAGLRIGVDRWVEVATATADWLLGEMQGAEGGFFSSTDADSPDGEGFYFTWTASEVHAALPPDQARLLVALCDLDGPPTFEPSRAILRPLRPLAEAAACAGVPEDEAAATLAAARKALLAARGRRHAPATDDKRLAGWNGMAVWALAWLGAALPDPRYVEAASRAGAFLLRSVGPDHRLQRAWRDGVAGGTETLEDLAWVTAGWLQLHEVTGRPQWLTAVRALLTNRLPHYQDEAGALFESPDDGPDLVLRPRQPLDGATPASAAVLAGTLCRLAESTGEARWTAEARRAVAADAAWAARAPEASATLLLAASTLAAPPRTLAIAGDPTWPATGELLATALRHAPADVVLCVAHAWPLSAHEPGPRLLADRPAAGPGAPLAYLCADGTCRAPIALSTELQATLSDLGSILDS